jgi:ankyrin repeat protein
MENWVYDRKKEILKINLKIHYISVMNADEKFIQSCKIGDLKSVKFFCPKSCIDFKDEKGNTGLSYAVKYWNFPVVKYLIQKGADINCRFHIHGYTPLSQVISEQGDYREFSVIETDKLERIKFLVDNGANINCISNSGTSLLMQVCSKNYVKIAQFLLERGADINYKTENIVLTCKDKSFKPKVGNLCLLGVHSALSESCRGDYKEEMISLLLKFGADKESIKETLQKYYIQNVCEQIKKLFGLFDSVNLEPWGILQQDGTAIPCKKEE